MPSVSRPVVSKAYRHLRCQADGSLKRCSLNGCSSNFGDLIRWDLIRGALIRWVSHHCALLAAFVIFVAAGQASCVAQTADAKPSAAPESDQQPDAEADNGPAVATQKYRYWNTDWSFEDVDVGSLADRLESIGVRVPYDVRGRVTVEFKVGIPLDGLRTAAAYRIDGLIRSPDLAVDDLRLRDLTAHVVLRRGVLTIDEAQTFVDENAVDADGVIDPAATNSTSRGGAVTAQVQLPVTDDATNNDGTPAEVGLANVALRDLPLGPLFKVAQSWGNPADESSPPVAGDAPWTGLADGKLVIRWPVAATKSDETPDWTRLNGRGDVTISNLSRGNADAAGGPSSAASLTLKTGSFVIESGVIKAPDVHIIGDDDIRLDAALQASLVDDRKFAVTLRGNDIPIDRWADLAGGLADTATAADDPSIGAMAATDDIPVAAGDDASPSDWIDGDVDLDITARGNWGDSLATSEYQIDGRIASPSVRLFGQSLGLFEHRLHVDPKRIEFVPLQDITPEGDVRLERVTADYQITPANFVVQNLDAAIDGGTIRGDAQLSRTDQGSHQLDLAVDSIRTRVNLRPITGTPSSASVKISGAIDWSVPADSIDRPAAHRGKADVALESIRVAGTDVGGLNVQLAALDNSLDLQADGRLFGGRLSVDSETVSLAGRQWTDAFWELAAGDVRISRLQLSRLMPIVRPNDRRPYSGTVTTRLVIDRGTIDVDARVSDLAVGLHDIGGPIRIEGGLRNGVVEIDDARGSLGGGFIAARGQWSLDAGKRRVDVRASRVNASDALSLINEVVSQSFDGSVTGQVTIRNGDNIRIEGHASARDSFVYGIPLGEVESPVLVTVANDVSHWSVRLARIHGDTYGGRLRGSLQFNSTVGSGFDMDGEFDVRRIDFGQMLAATADVASFAHGELTGTLNIGGRGIRGVNDLRGRYAASLGVTTGEAVPGLPAASRFFAGASLGDSRFTDGRAAGSIAQGAVVVDEFVLRSSQVLVAANGKVFLPRGRGVTRMDMEAAISTGNFTLAANQVSALTTRLALNAVIPGVTLLQVSRYLSNRTVFVDVDGVIGRPRVRIRPLETAQAAVGRLLIEQLIPAVGGDAIDDAF